MLKWMLTAAVLCTAPIALAGASEARSLSGQSGLCGPTIAGAINPDGTAQVVSDTYSSSNPSTGSYLITFKRPYVDTPICLVTPIGNSRVSEIVQTATTCEIDFVDLTSGDPAETLFNFVAVQISH